MYTYAQDYRMDMDDYISPYSEGWGAGYHDEYVDCPYPEGSKEYDEWNAGYEQGCRDC